MKRFNWDSNARKFFLYFFLGGLVGTLIGSLSPNFILSLVVHPVTAAWVQAFGVIGALVITVWTTKEQVRKEDARIFRRELSVKTGLVSLMQETVSSLEWVARDIRSSREIGRDEIGKLQSAHSSVATLEKVPFHEHPYSEIHQVVYCVISCARDSIASAEKLKDKIRAKAPEREVQEAIDDFIECVECARENLNEALSDTAFSSVRLSRPVGYFSD